jgi:hypothetical protein
VKKNKLRRVFVYESKITTMDRLRPGDLFSMDPTGQFDLITGQELYLATGNPGRQEDRPKEWQEIEAVEIHPAAIKKNKK